MKTLSLRRRAKSTKGATASVMIVKNAYREKLETFGLDPIDVGHSTPNTTGDSDLPMSLSVPDVPKLRFDLHEDSDGKPLTSRPQRETRKEKDGEGGGGDGNNKALQRSMSDSNLQEIEKEKPSTKDSRSNNSTTTTTPTTTTATPLTKAERKSVSLRERKKRVSKKAKDEEKTREKEKETNKEEDSEKDKEKKRFIYQKEANSRWSGKEISAASKDLVYPIFESS